MVSASVRFLPATGTRRAAGGTILSICGPKAPITTEIIPEMKLAARATLYALMKLFSTEGERNGAKSKSVRLTKKHRRNEKTDRRMYTKMWRWPSRSPHHPNVRREDDNPSFHQIS